jgi:hypothetical protein
VQHTQPPGLRARTIVAACARSWISDGPRDSDLVSFGTALRWPFGFGFSPRIRRTIETVCRSNGAAQSVGATGLLRDLRAEAT